MSLFERVLRPPSSQRDWIFAGFVGLAVVTFSFVGVQRARYRSAIRTFDQCAAEADAIGAATALERLRSLDATDVQTRIAEAEMLDLGGDGEGASAALGRALQPKPSLATAPMPQIDPDALDKLSSGARGDALLVEGDVAALLGDAVKANARWTEAAGIVDESLLAPRRRRLDDRQQGAQSKLSADLESLRADFDSLFDSARNGSDGVAYAATAMRARVQTISPPLAVQKLTLAVDAAARCATLTRQQARVDNSPTPLRNWTQPQPPIAPSDADAQKRPYLRAQYEREQQMYTQNLARWESRKDDLTRQRYFADEEIGKTAESLLDQARGLRDDGLALASRSTMPTR
jgi:hypothetical protein